ncbi:hypothetical protein AB0I52_32685, partial [Streptomyces sp. NPDC050423]
MAQHLGHAATDHLQHLACSFVGGETGQTAHQFLPASGPGIGTGTGHSADGGSSGGGDEVAQECGDGVGTGTECGDVDRKGNQGG